MVLFLLDHGAGNVQSLANSIRKLGYEFSWISSPADFDKASVCYIIYPLTSSDHNSHRHRFLSFQDKELSTLP